MKKIKNDERITVFIDFNKRLVLKKCNPKDLRRSKDLYKEYENLKKISKFKLKSGIFFPRAVSFSHSKSELKTKYISGINLKDILNEKVYAQFGRALKRLHEEGVTHGHLEVQDVIYKNKKFYLVDLPNLNKFNPLKDYARFKISIALHKLKNPLNWLKYGRCSCAFTKGYKPNKKSSQKHFKKEANSIIKRYLQKDIKNKIKGIVIYALLSMEGIR